jgi:hypothetical protein
VEGWKGGKVECEKVEGGKGEGGWEGKRRVK